MSISVIFIGIILRCISQIKIHSTIFSEIGCSTSPTIMSWTKTGTSFHGLVLVDIRRTSFSVLSTCYGLLLSWGHKSLLPCRIGDSYIISQAYNNEQLRLECRQYEKRHWQCINEILQAYASITGKIIKNCLQYKGTQVTWLLTLNQSYLNVIHFFTLFTVRHIYLGYLLRLKCY